MSDFNSQWIKKWSLSRDDFKDLPSGEKALVWALKKGKVDETAYIHWAKKHYKCPTIQKSFFDKSVDFNLLEKFSGIYPWNFDCYPVHVWKGRVLVACLEPPEKLKTNSKFCFAIAPFSAMDKAWRGYHKKERSKSVSEMDSSFDEITEDVPVLGKDSGKKNVVSPVPGTGAAKGKKSGISQVPKTVSETDSSFDEITEDVPILGKDSGKKKSVVSPVPGTGAEKKPGASQVPKTASEIDFDFSSSEEITNASVSDEVSEEKKPGASQVSKTASEIDFDFSSSEEITNASVSGEVSEEKKPGVSQVSKPASEIDFDFSSSEEITNASVSGEVSKEKKPVVLKVSKSESVKEDKSKTSPSSQTSFPSKFVITDQDLFAATDINKCKNLKQIISYIFYYLKEDYKKLMFVECAANGQYLPRFVYGSWHMTDLAWKTSVNVTDPNIFRIVYNSKLPFHGTVVDNEFNKRYYQWWTNNKRPDFATIYPFHYNQFLYGFLVCFNRTLEFDQNITLKKIKNLLSLSKNRFIDTYKHSKTSS